VLDPEEFSYRRRYRGHCVCRSGVQTREQETKKYGGMGVTVALYVSDLARPFMYVELVIVPATSDPVAFLCSGLGNCKYPIHKGA